jgi:RNA polymerase sigma-70 factor (ECF subfamily)
MKTPRFPSQNRSIGPNPAAPWPSDAFLVAETLAGRRSAFNALIVRYEPRAIAVAHRLLGNTHDSLDIAQDAFLKAFLGLSTLQNPESFGSWLMRIVTNLALNSRRSRKSRDQKPLHDQLPAAGKAVHHRAELADATHQLVQALSQLPPRQRAALVSFAVEQTPQKQIASNLGCSVEAVKWHVFQGRKTLRVMLGDE